MKHDKPYKTQHEPHETQQDKMNNSNKHTKHNMNNTSDGQHLKNSNTQQNNITTTQMTTQRTITLANLHKTLNEESHQSKYNTNGIMHTHEQ